MNIALDRLPIFAAAQTAFDALRSFAASFAGARRAAKEIERYNAMSDAELALRGLDRETLTTVVLSRHL